MGDMIINGRDLLPPGLDKVTSSLDDRNTQKDFSTVLKDAVKDINKLQQNADNAIARVQLDDTASIHEAMVALEKADISFRAMMQVRNKILEAYQEVMRIQV
jgi:flagellar hook-basal body complex protein FliE